MHSILFLASNDTSCLKPKKKLFYDFYTIVTGGMVMTSSGQAQTVVTSMGTVVQSPMQTIHGQAVVASQQQVKNQISSLRASPPTSKSMVTVAKFFCVSI